MRNHGQLALPGKRDDVDGLYNRNGLGRATDVWNGPPIVA